MQTYRGFFYTIIKKPIKLKVEPLQLKLINCLPRPSKLSRINGRSFIYLNFRSQGLETLSLYQQGDYSPEQFLAIQQTMIIKCKIQIFKQVSTCPLRDIMDLGLNCHGYMAIHSTFRSTSILLFFQTYKYDVKSMINL